MTIIEIDRIALSKTRLFGGLPKSLFEDILACAVVKQVGKGQVLFRQGEPADQFFAVVDGWVKIVKNTVSGDEAVLNVFGCGETFAEAAMFLDGTYPATAITVQPSRLCSFNSGAMRSAASKDSEIVFAMLGSLSKHLHGMTEQIEQLKTRSGEQRLARFLIDLCGESSGACEFELPYDKILIAARLGMRAESLSRFFANLADAGVKSAGRHISIEDVSSLREYSDAAPQRRGSQE